MGKVKAYRSVGMTLNCVSCIVWSSS